MNIITLHVTCVNSDEAERISRSILEKRLAACVKTQPISSSYWWTGTIESNTEVLLIIESVAEKFDEIETAIRELHSYETFVLLAYPSARASVGVEHWLSENIDIKK